MEIHIINITLFFWMFIIYLMFYYDSYPYVLLLWPAASLQYENKEFQIFIIVVVSLKLIIELLSFVMDLVYKK